MSRCTRKTGVPCTAEEGDRFGSSLAGDANHLAVGSPGEAIGTDKGAGGVAVLNPNKLDADNMSTPMFGLDQDLDTFSGGATQRAEVGQVSVVRIKADGTWDQQPTLWQGTSTDTVSGTAEAGDRMGERLTAVNTPPARSAPPRP